MAISKSERFIDRNLELVVEEESINFPPAVIKYQGKKLFKLGPSNKADLIESSEEYDRAEQSGQFIYCSEVGDMYDCCIYVDTVGQAILKAIRTRLK